MCDYNLCKETPRCYRQPPAPDLKYIINMRGNNEHISTTNKYKALSLGVKLFISVRRAELRLEKNFLLAEPLNMKTWVVENTLYRPLVIFSSEKYLQTDFKSPLKQILFTREQVLKRVQDQCFRRRWGNRSSYGPEHSNPEMFLYLDQAVRCLQHTHVTIIFKLSLCLLRSVDGLLPRLRLSVENGYLRFFTFAGLAMAIGGFKRLRNSSWDHSAALGMRILRVMYVQSSRLGFRETSDFLAIYRRHRKGPAPVVG
ncbi:hypothetical protein NQ317_015929 [Molorchus minor]|uniref:Uncharacterized protein n=1 Tax=Molorchus minor TaxID=1323400 RepID=A0ABQ9IUM8_9CUCU|nr:hypothetical protein NQ317_015929 [Molorchus minor]